MNPAGRLPRTLGVGASCGVAAVCIVGCAPDTPAPETVVRDSAGVSIVTVREPSPISTIYVDSTPDLRIAGPEDSVTLHRVADARRREDGSLVVLDGGSREVRFFSPEGVLDRVVGGEGEGPGEFDRFTSISPFRGDSLLVFDPWLRRATIYDRDGNRGRVLSLDFGVQARDLIPIGSDRLLGVLWSLEEFQDVAGSYRLPYHAVLMSPEGVVLDTTMVFAGSGGYKVPRDGGGYRDFAPLMIEDGHVAAGRAGGVLGSAESWVIRRLGPDGRVRQVLRVPWLDRVVSAEEVERERDAMVRPQSSAEYRAFVDDLEAPETRPAYGDLVFAENGWVWAAEYRSHRTQADQPVRWLVFDEVGVLVGEAMTPARFALFEVGSEHLIGVRRDSLDVETLEVLGWSAPPPA